MPMSGILLVGTVSNAERNLQHDLMKVLNALSNFKKISVFLVESDSSDQTSKLLTNFASQVPNFSFLSLGNLRPIIPDRIDRIRYCRNQYVSYIRNIPSSELPMYIAVADLDGMNKALSRKALASCFIRKDWDVVLSNQKFGYYDIFALRHEEWQPNDCFTELEELKRKIPSKNLTNTSLISKIKLNLAYDRARNKAIYSKMIRINKRSPWIRVNSGFGGFAIYKSLLFLQHDYSAESLLTKESEHVALHNKIVNSGGKIFINPALINSNFNTYNINRIFIVREIRRLINKDSQLFNFFKKILWKL
jgi:hypothetical protein